MNHSEASASQNPNAHGTFREHATAVHRRLCGLLSQVVNAVGADVGNRLDLAERLNIHKNLAWKICKLVTSEEPHAMVQHLPGTAGMNIFLRAAESEGAPPKLIASARSALDDLDHMIEMHGGDRTTFDILMGDLSDKARQQRDEQYRRLAFQGNSYILGAQAKALLKIAIVGPSAKPGLGNYVVISQFKDFQRLRSNLSWVMANQRITTDDGTLLSGPTIETLDENSPDGMPLLRAFCSEPSIELRSVPGMAGHTNYELIEGPIGKTGLLTCTTGVRFREALPYLRSPGNEIGEHIITLDTPIEQLIIDFFVHDDLGLDGPPTRALYTQIHGGPRYPASGRDRDLLPMTETIDDLGRDAAIVATPEIPMHEALVRYAFECTDWNPQEFRAYRFKMRYPPIPAALVLRYTLPEG